MALYVSGDHVISHDGAGSASGDTSLFLAYKRHPAVAPHLGGAKLGSADEEARDWLLIDQSQQLLYLAEVEEARRFLAAQWPRYAAQQENTEAELAWLLEDDWREELLPWDWRDHLAEAVRESRANYALMMHWLDQAGAR